MDLLIIDGLIVPVAPGTLFHVQQDGQLTRSTSGKLRNDIPGRIRRIPVQVPEISTSQLATLRATLEQPGPLPCSGVLVNPAADFHVGQLTVEPVTATEWRVSFELIEADYS